MSGPAAITLESSLRAINAVSERLQRYEAAGVDPTIGPHDNMFQSHRRDHYFAVGRDAVGVLARAMIQSGVTDFGTVLDLPSGSGRVLRHLVRFLPGSRFIASDIDANHVAFCARQFNANVVVSNEQLANVVPSGSADLIWCGSLLTHFDERRFATTLCKIVDWLTPGGLAIVTLHGRWSIRRQSMTSYKYMADELFEPVAAGVAASGFGYNDYGSLDRVGQRAYGLSVSLPSWVLQLVESMEGVQLLDYTERGWDNHQDVMVVRKVSITAKPWIFEEQGPDR